MKTLTPQKDRLTSPETYLAEMSKDKTRRNIESVRFIPPKIGGEGFGSFQIRYKIPVAFEE